MKLATIGIAMLGDERRSVMERLEPKCREQMERLAQIIRREKCKYVNGESPPVVVAPKVVSSIRDSKEVGAYLASGT